jgi:hypothetical protein
VQSTKAEILKRERCAVSSALSRLRCLVCAVSSALSRLRCLVCVIQQPMSPVSSLSTSTRPQYPRPARQAVDSGQQSAVSSQQSVAGVRSGQHRLCRRAVTRRGREVAPRPASEVANIGYVGEQWCPADGLREPAASMSHLAASPLDVPGPDRLDSAPQDDASRAVRTASGPRVGAGRGRRGRADPIDRVNALSPGLPGTDRRAGRMGRREGARVPAVSTPHPIGSDPVFRPGTHRP